MNLSDPAREAGFKIPIAVTEAVYAYRSPSPGFWDSRPEHARPPGLQL